MTTDEQPVDAPEAGPIMPPSKASQSSAATLTLRDLPEDPVLMRRADLLIEVRALRKTIVQIGKPVKRKVHHLSDAELARLRRNTKIKSLSHRAGEEIRHLRMVLCPSPGWPAHVHMQFLADELRELKDAVHGDRIVTEGEDEIRLHDQMDVMILRAERLAEALRIAIGVER